MANRVHHLNCVSSCPLGGALMDGRTASLRGRLACHCLLVETGDGLVLVDTGFGIGHTFGHAGRKLDAPIAEAAQRAGAVAKS